MKLLKPTWVHHDEKPIFSVDVHQECLKFATGGQGMDSGRVVIWNLLPVLSEKAELDNNVPKMLCQMDNHLACVNCVRWSQNGQMLASGSDDKLVMIWRKSKGSSGIFGTGGIHKTVENWKCVATLRGHSGDVLDLAWAPQDRWLASCSIDNTIIVWDCQAFPMMVIMLKGHTGLVKGVAWDPVGKFLASQSDDRSVKIWKTSDWTCNSTITEPFEECGGTTHILRLSWSPDGQYLVSAHAMNGGGPTAQIIEREGWKCDKDFVGHRKAVTCVRFYNSILKRPAAKSNNKAQQYCCLAVGSRDRSLSVWMTALQRPLVVIHEIFSDSILDLSWGPDKYVLMACSGDGTVACLQFSEEELGTPLTVQERNLLYQRIYGKSVKLENGTGSNSGADILIENPELLMEATMTSCSRKPPTLPTFIGGKINGNYGSSNKNDDNISMIKTMSDNTNILLSSNATSTLSTPLENEIEVITSQSHNTANNNVLPSLSNSSGFETSVAPPSFASRSMGKQLETRASDGRRRITPVFIPLNNNAEEMKITFPSSVTASTSPPAITNNPALVPSHAITTLDLPTLKSVDEQRHLDTRLTKSDYPHEVNTKAIQTFPANNGLMVQQISDNTTIPHVSSVQHQASTTGPKFTITATSKCEFQKTALGYRVHVHNGFRQAFSGLLSKVTAFAMNESLKLWEFFVGSPIVNLNFCRKYVLLCSLDGSMRLLEIRTGSPVLPIIALNGVSTHCAFNPLGNLVSVVTLCGMLRIWDIETQRNVLSTSCSDMIIKLGAVQQLIITDNAVPMLVFGHYYSYCYSQSMQSWLVLSTKDPVMRLGLHTTISKDLQINYCDYPLTSVQASTLSFSGNCTGIDAQSNQWQHAAKISFIENQIKLCIAVNSVQELNHWYGILAFNLSAYGTEEQLRNLLNNLLGQSMAFSEPNATEQSKILTVPKDEILEMVLNVLKQNVKWQRIYMEYNELYENRKNKNDNFYAINYQEQRHASYIIESNEVCEENSRKNAANGCL